MAETVGVTGEKLCERCGTPFRRPRTGSSNEDWAARRYCSHGCVSPDVSERFAAKVNKQGPIPDYAPTLGPCWLWAGAQDGRGYGSFHKDGRTARAHRVSYELYVGPIPPGLPLDHLCRVPLCVRPSHLEPVTHAENSRRGLGGGLATACVNGHEFTAENTRITPKGHRRCRQCHREAMRGAR